MRSATAPVSAWARRSSAPGAAFLWDFPRRFDAVRDEGAGRPPHPCLSSCSPRCLPGLALLRGGRRGRAAGDVKRPAAIIDIEMKTAELVQAQQQIAIILSPNALLGRDEDGRIRPAESADLQTVEFTGRAPQS